MMVTKPDRRAYFKEFNAGRREQQKAYDRERSKKGSRRRTAANAKLKTDVDERQFIAIDSEGGDAGEAFMDADGARRFQPHKTFLWGASGREWREPTWLFTGRPLSSVEIIEWLLTLKKACGDAIYISYSFGYDANQIFADMPFEKAFDVSKGYPWADDPAQLELNKLRANRFRRVFWKNYAFNYLKHKYLMISRITYPNGDLSKYPVTVPGSTIRIQDQFGFFQSSFLKAIKEVPGAASPEAFAIIEAGKRERGTFKIDQIEMIKTYTAEELRALSKAMTIMRQGMLAAEIRLKSWVGAGSIGSALIRKHEIKSHLRIGELRPLKSMDLRDEQIWAHHAFFGGRIELLKSGRTKKRLYGSDVSSAYPYGATQTPSMQGGRWRWIDRPTRADVRKANILSMIHVKTHDFDEHAIIYPLPYRCKDGSIQYPREVNGYYMRDDVLGAFAWAKKFPRGRIELVRMCEFVPADPGAPSPFAFMAEMFALRLAIIADDPKDIREKVIKLGINSVYGKMAQSVGGRGDPPDTCSPSHAAAMTAWTRRTLLEAALTDPEAIVSFATDGIVSTRPLPLAYAKVKTLGAWEAEEIPVGGVFVQSGVYVVSGIDKKTGAIIYKSKTRGFKPSNLAEGRKVQDVLLEEVPQLWAQGVRKYEFDYHSYMTLGASIVSREAWTRAGMWFDAKRTLDLWNTGNKRDLKASPSQAKGRKSHLVQTMPIIMGFNGVLNDLKTGDIVLSAPSEPEWLNYQFGFASDAWTDDEIIDAGFR